MFDLFVLFYSADFSVMVVAHGRQGGARPAARHSPTRALPGGKHGTASNDEAQIELILVERPAAGAPAGPTVATGSSGSQARNAAHGTAHTGSATELEMARQEGARLAARQVARMLLRRGLLGLEVAKGVVGAAAHELNSSVQVLRNSAEDVLPLALMPGAPASAQQALLDLLSAGQYMGVITEALVAVTQTELAAARAVARRSAATLRRADESGQAAGEQIQSNLLEMGSPNEIRHATSADLNKLLGLSRVAAEAADEGTDDGLSADPVELSVRSKALAWCRQVQAMCGAGGVGLWVDDEVPPVVVADQETFRRMFVAAMALAAKHAEGAVGDVYDGDEDEDVVPALKVAAGRRPTEPAAVVVAMTSSRRRVIVEVIARGPDLGGPSLDELIDFLTEEGKDAIKNGDEVQGGSFGRNGGRKGASAGMRDTRIRLFAPLVLALCERVARGRAGL